MWRAKPIFDRDEVMFGYELLFRDGLENAFSGDSDEASRATLDRSLLMGLDILCDGRRAFVNCTRDTLLKGLVTLLPSTITVVEILENVPGSPDVVGACRKLKERRIPYRPRRLRGPMIPREPLAGNRGHHQSRNEAHRRGTAQS